MPKEVYREPVLVFVDQPPSVEEVVSGRSDSCPTGQTPREEGVEATPKVVDDVFSEFSWKSACIELCGLFLPKIFRQSILLEHRFRSVEKQLRAVFVNGVPRERGVKGLPPYYTQCVGCGCRVLTRASE